YKKLTAVADRQDILYFIRVIDLKPEDREDYEDPVVNAFAAPGGYMYVFKDLIDFAESDDELAGVIAHEIGHVTARHGIKRLQYSYGAMALQILSTQANAEVARGTNLALTSLLLEYSQKDEFEADRLGIRYMKAAGYDPQGVVIFLKKLRAKQQEDKLRQFSYWRTHPHLPERISAANIEATGTMEFKDYLNIIGSDD
ncbi:MAG: M48 family metalloprotease, partial [Candidatus Omnitrophica bacterium]|nr:M48 family metalloprotease [Candidatus Omnitrophota bacterium]